MITTRRAVLEDARMLPEVASRSFLESHGHSASKEEIDAYLDINFTVESFEKELSNVGLVFP